MIETLGDLRQRITLQAKSVTRNAIGEEVVAWADVATVWAQAVPVRGREYHAANQVQQTAEVRFFIRDRAGLSGTQRVLWDSVGYAITAIIPGTGPYRGFTELVTIHGERER